MPYITEEIWQKFNEARGGSAKTVMLEKWPQTDARMIDEAIVRKVEDKYDLIRGARNIRTERNIPPAKEVKFVLKCVSEEAAAFCRAELVNIKKQIKASEIDIATDFVPSSPMSSCVSAIATVYSPLEGDDIAAEKERLRKSMEKLGGAVEGIRKKLMNRSFVERAPKEVVAAEEARLKEYEEKLAKIEKNLELLGK
jgi:valyl-tRNA synthetase